MRCMISVSGCTAEKARNSQHKKDEELVLPRLFCELVEFVLFIFYKYIILDLFIIVKHFFIIRQWRIDKTCQIMYN